MLFRSRAAEDQDRQLSSVELANRADEIHSAGVREPKIEDNEIDPREVGAHASQQFDGALDGERRMARAEQRRRETVAHECGVVRDDHRLGRNFRGFDLGGAHVLSIGFAGN